MAWPWTRVDEVGKTRRGGLQVEPPSSCFSDPLSPPYSPSSSSFRLCSMQYLAWGRASSRSNPMGLPVA